MIIRYQLGARNYSNVIDSMPIYAEAKANKYPEFIFGQDYVIKNRSSPSCSLPFGRELCVPCIVLRPWHLCSLSDCD